MPFLVRTDSSRPLLKCTVSGCPTPGPFANKTKARDHVYKHLGTKRIACSWYVLNFFHWLEKGTPREEPLRGTSIRRLRGLNAVGGASHQFRREDHRDVHQRTAHPPFEEN
ncbi:hypothetical protein K439DRAFT_1643008 [Ramaria rubella]|nr:hypothetical protein K439DRAFT_1643008 [Ramaria rubella]